MRRRGKRPQTRAGDAGRSSALGPFETVCLLAVCLGFVGVLFVTYRAAPPSANVTATLVQTTPAPPSAAPDEFLCRHATVTDGDTLRCGEMRVRLASIDAPELPGHCRPGRTCVPGDPFASTENLRRIVQGRDLDCRKVDIDRYSRTVAFCAIGGRDLSCAQVRGGFAVIRYGQLSCN
jgi:endonuclease YncB( thermonuclease family)